MTYRIVNGNIVSVKPLDIDSSKANVNKDASKTSFSEILNKKLNKDINISKHANVRLTERNIELSDEDMGKLSDAFDKAENKGAKDSVILYKDLAFVASIKNRTIITAMPKGEENIFTNIDSVILL